MLTLATRPHGDGTQTRTPAPPQPLPPHPRRPPTQAPRRQPGASLRRSIKQSRDAAFENFERDLRARGGCGLKPTVRGNRPQPRPSLVFPTVVPNGFPILIYF